MPHTKPARPCRRYATALALASLAATLLMGARLPWLRQAAFSDYLTAHAPQVTFVRQAVAAWKTLPLWSPVYNAGYPLYANPLASPAYLPGWLGYLLPLPWGLNLALFLHLAWGVLGWGCWARRKGVAGWPWLGLAAGLLPKTLAHAWSGHLTLTYAVAWVPWLLLARGEAKHPWLPGGVLGIITLADPRAAPLAGLVWAVDAWKGRRAWRRWLSELLRGGLFAAVVAAPLWLPLAVFALHTSRTAMTFAERTRFSCPCAFLEFAYPLPASFTSVEFRFYVPWGIAWVALLGLAMRRGGKGWILAGLGALLAAGRYGPFAWLWLLPGMSLVRVPARFGWLIGWGLVWAAAEAPSSRPPGTTAYRRAWFFGGVLALILRGLAMPFLWGAQPAGYWGALAADIAVWWFLRPQAPPISKPRLWGLACVAALTFSAAAFTTRPLATAEQTDTRIAQYILAQENLTAQPWTARWRGQRVYSPSYSIGQWTAARLGLPLAYGVDPLQLAPWKAWLNQASNIPTKGYSVTLPPLDAGLLANAPYRPNTTQLARARVGTMVTAFPQNGAGWPAAAFIAGQWVYQNPAPCPAAWVERESVADCHTAPARLVAWSPNRITIEADGPGGLLVLTEVDYPFWQVRLDGHKATPSTARAPWRAVLLPPGRHQVTWWLLPWDLLIGWGIALLGTPFARWVLFKHTEEGIL